MSREIQIQNAITARRQEINHWRRDSRKHAIVEKLEAQKQKMLQQKTRYTDDENILLAVTHAELGLELAKNRNQQHESYLNWREAAKRYAELGAWLEAGIAYKAAAMTAIYSCRINHKMIAELYLRSALCLQRTIPINQNDPYYPGRTKSTAHAFECALGHVSKKMSERYAERFLDLAFFYYKLSERQLPSGHPALPSLILSMHFRGITGVQKTLQDISAHLNDSPNDFGAQIEILVTQHIQYFVQQQLPPPPYQPPTTRTHPPTPPKALLPSSPQPAPLYVTQNNPYAFHVIPKDGDTTSDDESNTATSSSVSLQQ